MSDLPNTDALGAYIIPRRKRRQHIGDTRDMTTMKGRLARVAIPQMDCAARYDPGPKGCTPENWQLCGCATNVADAMVAELKNPSEEMISAMLRGFHLNEDPRTAMRDALVNGLCFIETEGVHIPHEGVVNDRDEPQ